MGFKRSEYRRKFKEPSWDAHQEQYRELVSYRIYRRDQENHHNFVEWDWDTESDEALRGGGGAGERGDKRYGTSPPSQLQRHHARREGGGGVTFSREAEQDGDNEGRMIAGRGMTEREVQTPDWDAARQRDRFSKGKKRIRPEPHISETSPVRPKTTPGKERGGETDDRPPLLAYGWADGHRDVGCKKTFNVKSSMHGNNSQVFPAALRAMRRNEYAIKYREEQKRRENLRMRRLHAVMYVPPPDENVWMTEYQRNFSSTSTSR